MGCNALSLVEETCLLCVEVNLLCVSDIAIGLVEEDLQMNLGLALQMHLDKLWWQDAEVRLCVWVALLLVFSLLEEENLVYVFVTLLLAWWKKISR